MKNVVNFKPHTSMVVNTSSVQRSVYFIIGFGLILAAMVDPLLSTTWMAIANGVGILLVMLAVLGKRVVPVMQGTSVLHEPRMITNTLSMLIGFGVSVLAIAYPPESTVWAAYAHIIAIALVTQAIVGYDFLMGKTKATRKASTPVSKSKDTNRTPSTQIPKAA